jgi:ribosomal protein S18 acetylase RimI-like enzyme
MIREATINDTTELAILFDEYRIFYEKESDLAGATHFLKERIKNKESVIYIALDNDNKIAGYIQLYPLFSSTRMKRLWLLNDLYVNPAYRSKGYGESLLEKAKEFSKNTNACGLMLETAKTNTSANNLYLKNDWILDEEHNYYSWEPKI